MRRRLIAALAALVVAALGALVLVRYVQGADARAQAGEELVPVLVVDSEVAAGTDAGSLGAAVSVVEVPSRLAAPGSMADLDAVDGLVTTADLLPGEQVLAERFVDPSTLLPAGTEPRPEGKVEVSMTLEPQRAVGGVLNAGDRVGVLVSTPVTDEEGNPRPVSTQVLEDVLVTRLVSAGNASDGAVAAASATQTVTVTLALEPEEAPAVVEGMELGTVWLTLEQSDPTPGGTALAGTATTTTGGDK